MTSPFMADWWISTLPATGLWTAVSVTGDLPALDPVDVQTRALQAPELVESLEDVRRALDAA